MKSIFSGMDVFEDHNKGKELLVDLLNDFDFDLDPEHQKYNRKPRNIMSLNDFDFDKD